MEFIEFTCWLIFVSIPLVFSSIPVPNSFKFWLSCALICVKLVFA
jgi:hypothetical protein